MNIINVKTQAPDVPNEIVDRPVEPLRQWNGLALHASISNPARLTLTHTPSGLAVFRDLDWEPWIAERCALTLAALYDWDRPVVEIKADPGWPAVRQRARDLFAGLRVVAEEASGDAT